VQAVEHLIAIGCKRIAYLVNHPANHAFEPRWQAYTDSILRAGRDPEYIDIPAGSRAAAREGVRTYAAATGCPDGILCHNDMMAVGVYRGLCDLGLRIPEDVCLVGCDGIDEIEYLDHPLSTIEQPAEEMVRLACARLRDRIADPTAPIQRTVLGAHLVVRQSSQR
jgi:DNA-binding LacI/PurR family transcriptional regulator